MGYNDNPVYEPEKYGFEYVGTIELSEPDYSFDILAVLKNDKGYYIGTDSGCSCPSPWESHTADDFTGPLTVAQTIEEVTSLWSGSYDGGYEPEEFAALITKIGKGGDVNG